MKPAKPNPSVNPTEDDKDHERFVAAVERGLAESAAGALIDGRELDQLLTAADSGKLLSD